MRVRKLIRRASRLMAKCAPQERRVRRRTARQRFGPKWVGTYLPHYFAGPPADFHAELFDRLGALHARRGTKEATIAPRDGAKSTVITLAYVLFCALEQLEPFMLILSDSAGQAEELLGHIRNELETNEAIARDYPDSAGVGPVWRRNRVTIANGAATIAALGTGGRVRGRRARQARPSLVVFDDVENNDTITSPAKRAKAWRWATREVIPAGGSGTNFLSVGSALHREAVAFKLGQLPGWSGRTYKAVHRWPDRLDLWQQWERLATNLADPNREETAERFYAANRAEMDRGAVVYWPSRWPLVALMRRRAEIGTAAFDTEYQGVPSVEGLTEWPAEWFEDRPGMPFWFNDWPAELVFRAQSLDPSKGKDARTSDFQAHVRVGMDRRGTFWVEGFMCHEHPAAMVSHALDLADEWGPLDALVIENNDGLGLLMPEFESQVATRKKPMPLVAVTNTQNKVTRIRHLGLYLGRGQMRFHSTPGTRVMVDQFRDFGSACEYDDGPDTVELSVREIERSFAPAR
jgi:hypothetical protein